MKLIGLLGLAAVVIALPAVADGSALKTGAVFKDCDDCPEMVTIKAPGTFKTGNHPTQKPHPLRIPWQDAHIAYSFALGKWELTVGEYQACILDGVCKAASHRVIKNAPVRYRNDTVYNLNWNAAHQYVTWLAEKTGRPYRLPSRIEWLYAVRAGAETAFWWGNEVETDRFVCKDCLAKRGAKSETGEITREDGKKFGTVTTFDFSVRGPHGKGNFTVPGNPLGLHHMIGNVAEWLEDCKHTPELVPDIPLDGAPFVEGGLCERRTVMGKDLFGSYRNYTANKSNFVKVDEKYRRRSKIYYGLRVALTLD